MNLGWLGSLFYGLLTGVAEILPVSARAYNILLMKILGEDGRSNVLFLLIHLSVLLAIYFSYRNQIIRINRALHLASIPKKRRKRPLDIKSLNDFRVWRMTVIPVIIAFLFYQRVTFLEKSLVWIAVLTFINGVILYIPQFFPSANKDSRTLSPLEGLAIGIGGASSIIPGISGVGAALSIASICGTERIYALDIVMTMNMAVSATMAVYDITAIVSGGIGALSFVLFLQYLLAAAATFATAYLGIRILKNLARGSGYGFFVYYSWGTALFTFILNIMA